MHWDRREERDHDAVVEGHRRKKHGHTSDLCEKKIMEELHWAVINHRRDQARGKKDVDCILRSI
jgi:hypothetical protein